MKFIKFMASENGRVLRVLVGALLIVVSLAAWNGLVQLYTIIVGLVLIAVGLLDVCLLAPFFNKPMSGKKIRG